MTRCWAVPLAILALAIADVVAPLSTPVHAQSPNASSGTSWTDSITSPFKQGFDKLGRALTPKPLVSEDDAISLKSMDKAKPGPKVYVAVAHAYEQQGKTAEAEQQYLLALKLKRDDLPALLGYAQMKDGSGKPDEAIQIYQRAAKAHPQEAAVFNNLGMCYARQNRLDEAFSAMNHAVQLDPKNSLYRNNIATVLVEQGKSREAFVHLREVHGNAAAYYNMGYLLNKKGQTQAAVQHFTLALKADPSMNAARQWAEYLQRDTTQSRVSQPAVGAKAGSQPKMLQEGAMMLPDEKLPRRLPPIMPREPASAVSSLPGISYERSPTPTAPLPPASMNSALQPLPQVR